MNKNLGEWDFDKLADFDESMLKDVGFDSKEIDRIFQLSKPEDDDAPDLKAESTTKIGDIFLLGAHKIMCGDSTNLEHVKTLMGGGCRTCGFSFHGSTVQR